MSSPRLAANLLLSLVPILLSPTHTAAQPPTPVPLGVHLFVDDLFLDPATLSPTNVTFALGSVHKDYDSPIVVPAQNPWEASIGFYTSAVTCDPRNPSTSWCGASSNNTPFYSVYYTCTPEPSSQPVTLCMATSLDGVTWSKPMLPFFVWNGSHVLPAGGGEGDGRALANTNAVFQTNDTVSFPGSVFLDTGNGVPPSERWKLTYEGAGSERLLYLAVSPDGQKWTPYNGGQTPIISERLFSDTQTAMVVGEPDSGGGGGQSVWTAFGRSDTPTDPNTSACSGAYPSLRRVLGAVSNVSAAGPFSQPVELIVPGDPDEDECLDDYNPAPFVGEDGTTFFLVSNFWHFSMNESGATGYSARINDGIQDVRLAFTRASPPVAGVDFHASRDPIIPRGIGTRDPGGVGAYNLPGSDKDAGFVFATSGGLLDPDVVVSGTSSSSSSSSSSSESRKSGAPWPFPYTSPISPWMTLLWWGCQCTHTGGGHASYPEVWHGILRGRIRREGFVGLRTLQSDPWATAEVATIPLSLPTRECSAQGKELWLLLNVETSVGGYVLVEVRNGTTGQPLDGFGFADSSVVKGNSIRSAVGWWVRGAPSREGEGEVKVGVSSVVGDPPMPQNVTNALPEDGGEGGLVLGLRMKHATIWSWDLQCVASAPS